MEHHHPPSRQQQQQPQQAGRQRPPTIQVQLGVWYRRRVVDAALVFLAVRDLRGALVEAYAKACWKGSRGREAASRSFLLKVRSGGGGRRRLLALLLGSLKSGGREFELVVCCGLGRRRGGEYGQVRAGTDKEAGGWESGAAARESRPGLRWGAGQLGQAVRGLSWAGRCVGVVVAEGRGGGCAGGQSRVGVGGWASCLAANLPSPLPLFLQRPRQAFQAGARAWVVAGGAVGGTTASRCRGTAAASPHLPARARSASCA